MKSIKPGRGPSMMGGIGGLFTIGFGILWTISAINMGAPLPFALCGVLFVGLAIVRTMYDFKNAKSKDRYSIVDIVDETEESDPMNLNPSYCPYCGNRVGDAYDFCPKCGKKLPKSTDY